MNKESRTECMHAAYLVTSGVEHFYKILTVAKMPTAPNYTKILLSTEMDTIKLAHEKMMNAKSNYSPLPETCEATMMFVKVAEEKYNEAKSDYDDFIKHSNNRGR